MTRPNKNSIQKEYSSFRDPDGFIFYKDGSVYRHINHTYKEDYDLLKHSGLLDELIKRRMLISSQESTTQKQDVDDVYKILKAEKIPFISYPYEWSFSQLKDAALLTLEIQKLALQYGMTLKDCSSYNIQWFGAKPILIDTLSFTKYTEGLPWIPYRQFCQHFLAPLCLIKYKHVNLNQLLKNHIDGIPLGLASTFLPKKTLLKIPLLIHIHLHSKSQQYFATKQIKIRKSKTIKKNSLPALIDSLESTIKRMTWKHSYTEWRNYYDNTTYSSKAFEHKKKLIDQLINKDQTTYVLDIGANTGIFSRICRKKEIYTVSCDADPVAIEKNYLDCKKNKDESILSLIIDITNPSPGIGWINRERKPFIERNPNDTVIALALIHHLAISNNIPLKEIAVFFSNFCHNLIIEFVPKSDSQVKILLATREDIFNGYTQVEFEKKFEKYFLIKDAIKIVDSKRTLYRMEKRSH